MSLETTQINKTNRNELIKSYGFIEQIASNENFLKESLELATRICGTEIAYISLLDDEKQYTLSQHGEELKTIKVKHSICQYTIQGDEMLVIENARLHKLTKYLPQVKQEGGITFYAGCPLTNSESIKIGALCVMDKETKSLSQTQLDMLAVLSKQVMTTLDNQRNLIQLIKKINANFKPAACAGLNCLQGELNHLQDEVITQNNVIKEQKLALENANKELTNFANVVAHDVRAPLRTISSFIMLHERELQKLSISFNKEPLTFIKQGATNLDELTADLLDYAKSGKDSIKNEKLHLDQILKTVQFNLTESINRLNAKIVFPIGQFFIQGNKLHMIQLFQNLISNGLKYQSGKEWPSVEIQAKEVADKVRISVIDNGIGISQEHLKKIFEPFKRLHTKTEYPGSGIGLATCKKIMDTIDSEILVSSELGKGSIFTFDLPKPT